VNLLEGVVRARASMTLGLVTSVLLLCLSVLGEATGSQQTVEGISTQDLHEAILEGLKYHESLIRGLSVVEHSDVFELPCAWEDAVKEVVDDFEFAPPQGMHPAEVRRVEVDLASFDGARRRHLTSWRPERGGSARSPDVEVSSTYDGEVSMYLDMTSSHLARREGLTHSAFGEIVEGDPFFHGLGSLYSSVISRWYQYAPGYTLSGAAEKCGFEVISTDEMVGGRRCYLVEIKGSDELHELARRVWLDPERGFCPVRHVRFNAYTGQIQQVLFGVELREIGEGQWFPVEAKFLLYNGGDAPPVFNHYTTSEVQVGVDFEDGHFQIEFPLGTRVFDRRLGVNYYTGTDSNEMQRVAREAVVWADELWQQGPTEANLGVRDRMEERLERYEREGKIPESGSSRRRGLWPFAIAAGCCVGVVVLVRVLRRTR